MRARSSRCFDFDFYLKSSAHLLHLDNPSPADLWEHFVRTGQFKLRAAHRFAALSRAAWALRTFQEQALRRLWQTPVLP